MRRIRDIVNYGATANQLGINVFDAGEHHTSRFVMPSPAVVLAAVAARTSPITLASATSVLNVLDPAALTSRNSTWPQLGERRSPQFVGLTPSRSTSSASTACSTTACSPRSWTCCA